MLMITTMWNGLKTKRCHCHFVSNWPICALHRKMLFVNYLSNMTMITHQKSIHWNLSCTQDDVYIKNQMGELHFLSSLVEPQWIRSDASLCNIQRHPHCEYVSSTETCYHHKRFGRRGCHRLLLQEVHGMLDWSWDRDDILLYIWWEPCGKQT